MTEPSSEPAPARELPAGDYAIVEILGHRTYVGRIAEVERFGSKLMQVEAGRRRRGLRHGPDPSTSSRRRAIDRRLPLETGRRSRRRKGEGLMSDPIEIDLLLSQDWRWQEFGGRMMLVTDGGGAKVVLAPDAHFGIVTRGPQGILIPIAGDTSLGKFLAAVPAIVEASRYLRAIRPSNWNDGEDSEQQDAWSKLDAAFEAAAIDLNIFGPAPVNGEEGAR